MAKRLIGQYAIQIFLIIFSASSLFALSHEASIMQEYHQITQNWSNSPSDAKNLSASERWVFAQAHYLLGEYTESKSYITPLLKDVKWKTLAQKLQLYIAILEDDKNLSVLLQTAQKNQLFPQDITKENARSFIIKQSPKQQQFIQEWHNSQKNIPMLESLRQKQEPFHPNRILLERELANLYFQTKNKEALSMLANKATLLLDRQAFTYNLALLYYDNKSQQIKLLQQVTQAILPSYRVEANFALYLHGVIDQNPTMQDLYAQKIKKDLPANHLYLLFIQLQEEFLHENYSKSILHANKLIASKEFPKLPTSIQQYTYHLRAYSKQQASETKAAITDYKILTTQFPNHPQAFAWYYALLILEPSINQNAHLLELQQLSHLAVNAEKQKKLLFLHTYYAFLQAQMPQVDALLGQTQTIWRDEALYLALQALYARHHHNYGEAAQLYNQVAKRIATHNTTLKAIAFMHSATNYIDAQLMLEANFQLKELLNINIRYLDNIDVKFLLAQTLFNQKESSKALELFEESYQLSLKPTRQIPFLLSIPSQKEIALQYYLALQATSTSQASAFLQEIASKENQLAQEITHHYAQELFNQGKYRESAQLLEASLSIVSAHQHGDLLYQTAIAYELAKNLTHAKELYIQHLERYPLDRRSVSIARRLASLSTYQELNKALLSAQFSEETENILRLVWVQKSPTSNRDYAHQWLANRDFSAAPAFERNQRLILLARFYQKNNAYDQALSYWLALINQAENREDHQEARYARMHIFEAQNQLALAVNELIALANTLKPWPEEAFKALRDAYNLCIRHDLLLQAEMIQHKIEEEYPQFAHLNLLNQ